MHGSNPGGTSVNGGAPAVAQRWEGGGAAAPGSHLLSTDFRGLLTESPQLTPCMDCTLAVVSTGDPVNPSCGNVPEWSQPFAAKGVAWPCLGSKMSVPYYDTPGCYRIRTSTFNCSSSGPKGGCFLTPSDPAANELFSRALLVVLVLVHGALLISPILATVWVWNARERLEAAGVNSVGIILASMPVFSLASFGEISQHIFDNWLFLGLMPTVYVAVFYGGLAFAQALLTSGAQYGRGAPVQLPILRQLGVHWYDLHAAFDIIVSVLAFVFLVAAWGSCSNGPATAPSWADCYGTNFQGGNFVSVWAWAFVVALFCTVSAFFIRVRCDPRLRGMLTVASAVSFVAGMVGVLSVLSTGCQVFHAVGASGFLLGFVFQLIYLLNVQAPAAQRAHAE